MAWEFSGGLTVKAIKFRRGSKADAPRQLVVHVLIPEVDCATVARILGTNVSEAKVKESFFRPNEEQDTLYDGLQKLHSQSHFDNQHAIRFADREAVQVKKIGEFLLIPRKGAVFEVECNVTIADPPKGLSDDLGDCINTSLPFELLSSELPLEGGENPPPDNKDVSQRGKASRKVH